VRFEVTVSEREQGASRSGLPPPGGATREVVVPRDARRRALTAVRSLLLQSSLSELKNLGHFEAYLEHMDRAALEHIQANIGPGWLPSELAVAHYAACDGLALTPAELEQIGGRVGTRLQSALPSTFVKSVRQAGFTPWLAIGAYARIADRLFEGSSAEFVKVGPKDLEIGIQGNPLFASRYFRAAYGAATRSAFLVLGARTTYVKLSSYRAEQQSIEVRISWV
jgi:hypothetical protein